MKLVIYASVAIFGIIGSYLPVLLFGVGYFDLSSIFGGVIGSIVGILVGFKIAQNLEL